MKDKKNVIIAILTGIIILGFGYILGSNTGSNKKTSKEITQSSSTYTTSEPSNFSSTKEVERTASTLVDEVESNQQLSEEEIAFDKFVSLEGRWGVPQSGNMFTITSNGKWIESSVGRDDMEINISFNRYDQYTNTIFLIREGYGTKIQINNDSEIIVDYGEGEVNTYIKL